MDPSPTAEPVRALAWPDAAPPPPPALPLIGRDELVADLAAGLAGGHRRAIALTGLGGVGKTRLAAEVARIVGGDLGGRVAWIPLASSSRDGGLAAAIAAGLGIAGHDRDTIAEAIALAIGPAPALLVLDGAETQLHDLGLVDELLELAPPLRLLVTTRIPPDRPGLAAIGVDTLALPAVEADADAVARSPAVALLVDRGERAGADVAINAASAAAFARLVARLDGLPLALELAAPLLRALPPHRLIERIGEQLDPVVATIDWSVAQLDPDDRRLYRRLAVFGVPFRARHVRTFGERALTHGLSPLGPDIAGGLERLAAAGLIRARPDAVTGPDVASGPDDPRGAEVREYELPALIRDDAERRLGASGEATAAHWARANDLLALCELSHAELIARSRVDLLEQLDIVHDDLLAALDRGRVAGEGTFLIRLSGALAEYWRTRGRLAEGRMRLDAALRLGPPDPTPERARALHGAGMLANAQSDYGRARGLLEEALAIRLELGRLDEAAATLNQLGLVGLEVGDLADAERRCREGLEIRRGLGDEGSVAASLNTLGGILQFGGRSDEAAELLAESVAIRRRLGDDAGVSVSVSNLALVARDRGDLDEAEAMLREAIATRERLGDRQRVAVVRHNLALVHFDRRDLEGAARELEAAIATSRELGDRLETANALSDLGFVAAAAGDRPRAVELQIEALAIAERVGGRGIVAQSIDGIAGIVAGDDLPEEAATLWAAAEAIRRRARYHLLLADRRRIDAEIGSARAAVDEGTWSRAWGRGEDLATDDAVARARAALGPAASTMRASGQVAV